MTIMPTLTRAAAGFALLLGELLVLFLIVASAVALAARRLGAQRLRRLLGGSRGAGALKGIALGFATPFCTYSAIPVLAAMLDAGVRTSTWLGFLLAAPVLDPLIAVALAVIFGPRAALAYTAATFVAILAAATIADAAGLEQPRTRVGAQRVLHAGAPAPVRADGCPVIDPLAGGPPWGGWRAETAHATRDAIALIRGMAAPLVIAVAFAVAIAGFVPADLIAGVAGPGNPLAVPIAAVAGTPFYVSGEAFLPIAAALQDKGMSAGAVFALLIAGAGVNIPELGLLSRMLDLRLLVVLVAAIFAIATLAGYVIPALLAVPGAV
jgi:hypothetical protein